MTAVPGTGHDASTSWTVPGHDRPTGATVSDLRGHVPTGNVPAVRVPVSTSDTDTVGTDTSGIGHVPGAGTDTAGLVSVPVTAPGRRRFLIFGARRTRVIGHVSMPVPVSVPIMSVPAVFDDRPRPRRGVAADGHVSVPAVPVPEGSVKPSQGELVDPGGRQIYRTLLTPVVALVASIGQVWYARESHFTNMIGFGGFDLTPWLAVAIFDLSFAALLDAGRRVIPRGLSPWPFWNAAFAVAGLSFWTNTQHRGGSVTAAATFVLFLLYFLPLLAQYKKWRQDNGYEAETGPSILFSKLIIIDRAVARRAYVVAATRPLAAAVKYRKELTGHDLTVRQVAVLAARRYVDIYTDQLAKGLTDVRWWERRKVSAAKFTARITATDNMDLWLGQPPIERESIKVSQIGYVESTETAPAPPARRKAAPPVDNGEPPLAQWAQEDRDQRAPRQQAAPRPPVAPARDVPVSPAPAGVPTVEEVDPDLYVRHAERIDLIKTETGDGWWSGPRPLSVDAIQALGRTLNDAGRENHGIANRGNAGEVARCLRRDRALKLAGQLGSPIASTTSADPEGE